MTAENSLYVAFRKKIEHRIDWLTRLIYRNPRKTLIIILVVTCLIGAQIPKINMDSSNEGMLHKNDPIRIAYNDFRNQFGRDDGVIIAINTPEIFDAAFLKKLKAFHLELEQEVPHAREVMSLVNARNTRGEGETLIVEDLLPNDSKEIPDLDTLKTQVMGNPILVNNLISSDGRYTAIIVETEALLEEVNEDLLSGFDTDIPVDNSDERSYLTDKEKSEIIRIINNVKERYHGPDFNIYLSGGPAVEDYFNRTSFKDAVLAGVLAPISVLVLPLILFRRLSGVILPYLIIMPSMLTALGLMTVFNMPFTLMAGALPPFIIAVGTGDAIHILTIFYQLFGSGSTKEDAIAGAMVHSGPAVLMTTITTAAGLLSLVLADLFALAHMGIVCAIGVIMALFYTLFMLPALIALFPLKIKDESQEKISFMDRFLLFFSNFSIKYSNRIVAVCLVILAVSVFLTSRLEFSNYPLTYLPDKMEIKHHTLMIDKILKGTIPLEVIVDTKKENGVYDPEILNRIETLSRQIEKINTPDIFVGKVFSINDILKEINQALHGNDPEYYSIPQDRKTIAQEFLLFENSGSDDLERVVDSEFRKTRITIKTSWVDGVVFNEFIKDIKARFNHAFLAKADISITGTMSIMARALTAAMHSTTKSYVIAFLIISLMMIFIVGNIRIGILSMIPNIIPILSVLAVMKIVGISMGMTPLLAIGVCIGIVVDDTVHFIYGYRKYYDETGDAVESMRKTFLGTGRAMLITSMILVCAFSTDLLCDMININEFGAIVMLIITFALIFDFLLLPALLFMVSGKSSTHQEA